MKEKELDSSNIKYIEETKPNNYTKQLAWDMAIGLQEVDNLKPSNYLEKLASGNVNGILTIELVEQDLREYYIEKDKRQDINHSEFECDFVAMRIVKLLEEDNFELSVDYLKYVHRYLFQDVYDFAGEFREIDFSKHCKTLKESLEYDISLETEKNYKEMSIVEVINNITKFSSNIWQVHPFRERNTRTTALFIEKYLISLGYNVDNTLFSKCLS